jgi:hypothetical protein
MSVYEYEVMPSVVSPDVGTYIVVSGMPIMFDVVVRVIVRTGVGCCVRVGASRVGVGRGVGESIDMVMLAHELPSPPQMPHTSSTICAYAEITPTHAHTRVTVLPCRMVV